MSTPNNRPRSNVAPKTPPIAMCKVCENGDIILPLCRLQYPALDAPKDYQGDGRDKYRATFIFPDSADLTALEEIIAEKMKDLRITKLTHPPIRDDKDNAEAGFNPGTRFANASSKFKPRLFDVSKNEIGAEFFYPGCYVRPRVNVYAWTNFKPNGVGVGLQAIQFVRDGEPLSSGGGNADPSDFDEIDENYNPDF